MTDDSDKSAPKPVLARKKIGGSQIRLKPKSTLKFGREQSSIGFVYLDMDTSIGVASSVFSAGGVPLSRDQLAGAMGTTTNSGTFLMKVAAARMFGLLTYASGKYELTNLGFAIVDKDERRQKAARAEAFLNVPLFRKTYEEFKGKQLPPRPFGLEKAFANFGVSSKQKATARIAFYKSAQQAGFFAAGNDRLIEPIIGTPATIPRIQAVADSSVDEGEPTPPPVRTMEPVSYHPFIHGLLDTLPEPQSDWAVEGRAKWLQAAANIFDLIYKGNGEIKITAKGEIPIEE